LRAATDIFTFIAEVIMSIVQYEETPFKWFDAVGEKEGARAWWQGQEGEEEVAQAMRNRGWKVTNINAQGSHYLGYDLLIEKAGKQSLRAEIKTQAGRYKDGRLCPTWFCELEAANGKPADWRRAGAATTHLFAFNKALDTISVFDRTQLKAATMSGRITHHNGCPGRLVGWQCADSGWIVTINGSET